MSKWIKKLTEAYSEVNDKQKLGEKVTSAGQEVDTAIKHDCATHVEHAEWGKGQPISEQHTIVETAPGEGYVTHYDVMFEHGIEKNVAVEDLTILDESSHGHMRKKKKNEAMDPVNKKELKGSHADRKDKDIDNDGDVDKSDSYLHNRRKTIKKAMGKGSSDEVEMSPTKKGNKTSSMAAEELLPPVYARIMEKRDKHMKGATEPEDIMSKESPKSKEFADMHKKDITPDDTEKKGHQDASAAGRKGPAAKHRPNDNKAGDKSIVNPVPGAVTK